MWPPKGGTGQGTPFSPDADANLYANPPQDVPASYVKEIESGEFCELSKLLPKNLSSLDDGEPLTLTMKNSVIKVSKNAKSTISITDIKQWVI